MSAAVILTRSHAQLLRMLVERSNSGVIAKKAEPTTHRISRRQPFLGYRRHIGA
jgi:hypothetical protein